MNDDPVRGTEDPDARPRFVAFRGRTPAQLVPTGLFRMILYGVVCWAIGRVAFDRAAFGDAGFAASIGRFGWLLMVGAVVCAVACAVNVARVVVGVKRFLSAGSHVGGDDAAPNRWWSKDP